MDVNPYEAPRADSAAPQDDPTAPPFAYKAIAIGYLVVIVVAILISLWVATG